MAEMGLGYGSEFQLLRYLGHHRNYLDKIVSEHTHNDKPIHWLDYPVNTNRDSGDGEYVGIECFQKLPNYKEIKDKWRTFWPQSGSSHNWDGIFIQDGVWYFVEAKAHLEEANQKCSAISAKSIETIINAFEETCGDKELAKKWQESDCYQLANRLAFVKFCDTVGIKAKVLYIGFVHGYEQNPHIDVDSSEEWKTKMEEEYNTLELSKELRDNIIFVTLDCHEPKDGNEFLPHD